MFRLICSYIIMIVTSLFYLFLFISFYILYNIFVLKETFDNSYNIPIVIIGYNNYFFVKNFVNQLKKYKNPIIILDNNSKYPELLNYYKEIKNELGNKIDIRILNENYGHRVYLKLKNELPDIYILSDPDLELNKNMPENFAEILLNISNKYKYYKVGAALNIDDNDLFVTCENNINIYDTEKQYWINKINDEFELYYANIDTTFCLINNNYYDNNEYSGIRVAGNFTATHLPWYKGYITNNISEEEIDFWKKNNISSSILKCL